MRDLGPSLSHQHSHKIMSAMQGDDLAPWNNGLYSLSISTDGIATVESIADGSADAGESSVMRMSAKALVTLWSGTRTATELHRFSTAHPHTKFTCIDSQRITPVALC